MPALASPSTWRTHPQTVFMYAYLLEPVVVFSRRVNQASFDYPVYELAFDNPDANGGAYGDVETGMTVRVKSSAGVFKGWGYIRAAATSTLLKITPIAQGDIDFADNDILEVLDDFRPWVKIPRIDPDGTQYKHWDMAFNAATAQPPVANLGAWYANEISSSIITVDFDGTGSFPVAPGATLTGYTWDVQDGTITIGTSTSSQITATFPAGRRWVKLTVTDSNGNTHTARALVVGDNGSYSHKAIVRRLSGDINQGWECSLELLDTDVSGYPEGTAVIVWAKERYGSTTGSLNGQTGRKHVKFTGWLVQDNTRIEPTKKGILSDNVIQAKSALGILASMPAFGITLQRSASPATWFDVASLNWWRQALYVLHRHSTLLEVCDLERPSFYADYPLFRIDLPSGQLLDQVQFVIQGAAARFTCDQRGIIYARRNPHLMGTSERAALTTIVTLQDTDWTEALDITTRHRPALGWLWMYGIVASETDLVAKKSAAPGTSPGQGETQDTVNGQVVVDQDDLNARNGRMYAWRNLSQSDRIGITVLNQGIIADPAWQEFVKFTTTAPNKRGLSYTDQPFVLVGVDIRYDHRRGVSLETWQLEKTTPDTVAAGITVQIPGQDAPLDGDYIATDGTYEQQELPPYEYVIPPVYTPDEVADGTSTAGKSALAWNTLLALTHNRESGSPDWAVVAGITGDVLSCIRLSSTRALVLTSSKIYDVTGLNGTPTVTLRQSLTDGKMLRYAEGVAGNIASGLYLLATSGGSPGTYTNNFTSNIGTAALTDGTFPFGYWANGYGAWSASGGRTDAGCMITTATGVSDHDEVTVYVDLGSEATVTAAQMWIKATVGSRNWGSYIKAWDGSKNLVSTLLSINNNVSNTSYVSRTYSGSVSDVRYLSFTVFCYTSQMDVYMDNLSITYTTAAGSSVTVKYSDDAWVAVDSTQTVATAVTGEYGYDVDDYDLGIHLAAANGRIYSSTSYTGTFAAVTGLSVPSGSVKLRAIRAILKVVATQVNNSTASAFQFIYATDSAISGKTLFLVTFARDTRVAATETDITPIISGTTYKVVAGDGNQLETYGGNTRLICGWFEPVAGGDPVFLVSQDGGTTWGIQQTGVYGQWVRYMEPGIGGNGYKVWAAGADGLSYTANLGATFTDKTSDFGTETGSESAVGIMAL